MTYNPAELPVPDKLHVLVLYRPSYAYIDKLVPDPVFEVYKYWEFPITYEFSVADETAIHYITKAWRGLTEGEDERCHSPAFGLRFFKADSIFIEASICWMCNNIFLRFPQINQTDGYAFDSQSESAQDLLRWLKYLYGR